MERESSQGQKRVGGEMIFILLFVVCLFLPGLQMVLKFIPEEKLYGSEVGSELALPNLTLRNFLTEKFQTTFVQWLDQRIGFRGHLIRTDNQLNYSVFREMAANFGSKVIVGKEHFLFEKLYIDSANGVYEIPKKQLEFSARQMLRLQRLLKDMGKPFLLLITPSKATVYPEMIPSRFLKHPGRSSSEENMNVYVSLLKEYGVQVFDSRPLVQSWKAESQYPLFPKGGTHWSEFVACKVGQEFIRELIRVSGREFRIPHCEPIYVENEPGIFDKDLADLSNLWNPKPFTSPLPYVDLTSYPPQPFGEARMLFVGGSFLWTILAHCERQHLYATRDFYYYYERHFRWPELTETKVVKKDIDWKRDIADRDVFVMEINEAYLHHGGMGFLRDALLKLK